MKTVAIIQARLNSTRLPGKVLLPIGDTNAIQMIVDKCKANKLIDEVIIATTYNSNKIADYCEKNNIKFWIGAEENVLDRVYRTAEFYKADIIVDITSDCPFIDLDDLQRYVGPIKIGALDYASNVLVRTFPDGLDLQVYSFNALSDLMEYQFSSKPEYYQHSGWNFTQHTDNFKTLNIYAPKPLNRPELRITLDTAEDYAVLNLIYTWLGKDAKPLEIVNFMKNNPKIMAINQNVVAKTPGEM